MHFFFCNISFCSAFLYSLSLSKKKPYAFLCPCFTLARAFIDAHYPAGELALQNSERCEFQRLLFGSRIALESVALVWIALEYNWILLTPSTTPSTYLDIGHWLGSSLLVSKKQQQQDPAGVHNFGVHHLRGCLALPPLLAGSPEPFPCGKVSQLVLCPAFISPLTPPQVHR